MRILDAKHLVTQAVQDFTTEQGRTVRLNRSHRNELADSLVSEIFQINPLRGGIDKQWMNRLNYPKSFDAGNIEDLIDSIRNCIMIIEDKSGARLYLSLSEYDLLCQVVADSLCDPVLYGAVDGHPFLRLVKP